MSDALDALRAALANRYAIDRELGRGGNAVVYLAQDQKHDRKVALKVLLPELALAVRAERFLREIQIAAKLTHPHILTLHDSGEVDGLPYYVMPYVEGESLRDRITREKQLSVEDALRITREVAAALGYAHGHGVVHRDIKPENILLSGGVAVVADFGIARALTAAGGGTITEAGIAVGTPAYMSPEQGSGSGEPDARSDIYSLGCVLYEMLAGHPPFTGATAQEVLSRHALDPIPTIRAARNAVPEALERIVTKALAKQPTDRFTTAAQFAGALTGDVLERPRGRRLAYAALGTIALLGGWLTVTRTMRPTAPADGRSIAVMPFENLSTDPENQYFSDGITEDLINGLARAESLRVVPGAAFGSRKKELSFRELAAELRVGWLLTGTVRKAGNRLRLSASLLDAADGSLSWSETYDREWQNAFAVQDELVNAIVGALRLKLPRALAQRRPENVEAYALYLRGRFFWNQRSQEGLEKAVQYFEAAVAKDSAYALAYSGLADSYMLLFQQTYRSRLDTEAKARSAAITAIRLGEGLAEAHTSLARVVQEYDWDFETAEREYRQALSLNPNYATAHQFYSILLRSEGRFEEAIQHARRAVEIDPWSPILASALGVALYYAHRWDESIEQSRQAHALDPDFSQQLGTPWDAYQEKGMLNEAIAAYEGVLQRGGRNEPLPGAGDALRRGRAPGTLGSLGRAYAPAGRRDDALKVLEELKQLGKSRNVVGALAAVYLGLEEGDSALRLLEEDWRRPIPERGINYQSVWRPLWDPVRSDPRFVRLLRQVRLIRD